MRLHRSIPLLRIVPDDTKFDFMRFRRISFPVSAIFSILAICLWAATVSAVLPLALRRLRIDPARDSARTAAWASTRASSSGGTRTATRAPTRGRPFGFGGRSMP